MKIINLLLSLVLASGLVACSQIDPVPRDQLAANLAPILKIEKRADGVKYYTQMLRSVDGMSDEGAGKAKGALRHLLYLLDGCNLQLGKWKYGVLPS